MKKKILYKFLRTGLKSDNGDCAWKVEEWKREKEVKLCSKGFHASKTPLQALGYVKGEILAEVEVRGESDIETDKEAWTEMKIVKAWNWTKTDSVELAIYAAELVLGIFEKKYPKDKRPRKAIEAAKDYLKNPNKKTARAADAAAYAAYAAAYAADAAYAAAYAARAAYAAYAARAADVAYAAYAAYAAARKQITTKIDKWFEKKLKTLKAYDAK